MARRCDGVGVGGWIGFGLFGSRTFLGLWDVRYGKMGVREDWVGLSWVVRGTDGAVGPNWVVGEVAELGCVWDDDDGVIV